MRPPKSFIAQPIRDLQTMLRVIAKYKNIPNPLIPDGIYGADTMQAVSDFQKSHGLPPTGTADQITWEAIVEAYYPAKINQIPAHPVHILLDANQVLRKGERNYNLYLAQAMLAVLSERYGSIRQPSFTGILDDLTAEAIMSFQKLNNLPVTGNLDKITWKNLALQYPLAADLDNLDGPGSQKEQNA